MKAPHTSPPLPRRFASESVVLLLKGALATSGVMALTGCAPDEPEPLAPPPGTHIVSQEQLARDLQERKDEENNSYVPGLGYYHSIHHGWYPYPFNYYYPGLGYYQGGSWEESRWSGALPQRSQPNWSNVTDDKPGVAYSHSSSGGYFYSGSHAGSTYGESGHVGSGGVTRGGFTAPHSSGFHAGGFGGGHGGS